MLTSTSFSSQNTYVYLKKTNFQLSLLLYGTKWRPWQDLQQTNRIRISEVCITNYHRSERLQGDTPRIIYAAPRFLGEHQGNPLRLSAYSVQPVHHTPERQRRGGAEPATQSAKTKLSNTYSLAFIKWARSYIS